MWLLSLTAHRPGGRTNIPVVGGTSTPREATYRVVPFDSPLSEKMAFGVVVVFDDDSVTEQYVAQEGELTMTRVTGMEAYGTFRFDAVGGQSLQDSSRVTASGDFRGYH